MSAVPRQDVLELIAEEMRPRFSVLDAPSRMNASRGRPKAEPIERFMSYVKKGDGPDACWIFTGGARFHVSGHGAGSMVSAAIFAWQFIHGHKPTRKIFRQCGDGRCIRHLGLKRPPLIGNSRLMMHTVTPEQERKRTGHTVALVASSSSVAASKVLAEVLGALEPLDEKARSRVLAAVRTFYEVGQ